MSQALRFNETTFDVIDQNGTPWLQARQIGQALGYSRPDAILNIYERNKDEFSLDMTTTIELMVGITTVTVRIFSLRGCHLLAMFARTPIAKAFRVWVLDVLDKLNAERPAPLPEPLLAPADIAELKALMALEMSNPDAPLTPDQQCTLQAVVKGKVENIPIDKRSRGLYPQIWSRFNNHFRLSSYKQLPQRCLSEGIAYLMAMELPAPLPAGETAAPATQALPCDISGCYADALHRIGHIISELSAVQEVVREQAKAEGRTLAPYFERLVVEDLSKKNRNLDFLS